MAAHPVSSRPRAPVLVDYQEKRSRRETFGTLDASLLMHFQLVDLAGPVRRSRGVHCYDSLAGGGRGIRIAGPCSRRSRFSVAERNCRVVEPAQARKALSLLRGTEGSNPSPSTGEIRSTQVRSPALAASATFVGSTNRSMSPSNEAEVAFVSPCALRV
jgi:hypothetical protein